MIITRTPLRISLAGGGTDLPEYYLNNKFGAVCSIAINKYVYISVKELPEEFPYNYKLAYSQTELRIWDNAITHPILKEAITTSGHKRLDFNSMSDIPSGTGMGSSSSFTVGTLHALSLLSGVVLSKESLAQKACELEIKKLKGSLGKQDQYAAAYGGINYIRFHADESVKVTPIILDPDRELLFMSHLRLYFLGSLPRAAEPILREQKKAGVFLDEIRYQAAVCTETLTHGTVEGLGHLLHRTWENKKLLSSKISSPEIDTLYASALAQGAYGGKLLGAGGAGYLLICCDPKLDLNLGLKRVAFWPDYQGSVGYHL